VWASGDKVHGTIRNCGWLVPGPWGALLGTAIYRGQWVAVALAAPQNAPAGGELLDPGHRPCNKDATPLLHPRTGAYRPPGPSNRSVTEAAAGVPVSRDLVDQQEDKR
jgi:hypothetical protein